MNYLELLRHKKESENEGWTLMEISELGPRTQSLVVALRNEMILILGGSLYQDGVTFDTDKLQVTQLIDYSNSAFSRLFYCPKNQHVLCNDGTIFALIQERGQCSESIVNFSSDGKYTRSIQNL